MQVIDIEVGKLMPYWHNPRKNDGTVEKLTKSIKKYGFNVPLVVNKDMVLITGHARLKAAKKLGLLTVPCVIVDLTEEQAKKYRIADNKIQESTEWNEEALFKELREIGDPLDLIDMGFTAKDVESIIGDIDSLIEEATSVAVDEVPEYAVATPQRLDTMPVQTTAEPYDGQADNGPSYTPYTPSPMANLEAKRVSQEELARQLAEREKELSGRFVRESYEQTKYDNIVVCPHCGNQFKVRGVK